MAGGSLVRTARRTPARREARANQSPSAFRLITAPHVHVNPHAVALDAAVEIAAAAVLLKQRLRVRAGAVDIAASLPCGATVEMTSFRTSERASRGVRLRGLTAVRSVTD